MFFSSKPVGAPQDENARAMAGKPAVAAPVAPAMAAARRPLGDLNAGQGAMMARPAMRPAQHMEDGAEVVMAPARPTLADVPNVDAADVNAPEFVSEYVQNIYDHFRRHESSKTATFGYMASQTDINEKMRAILIDWLVEVHLKFKLMPETLYLTVNIIDRFLERKLVKRDRLQLVGVTAMLLASKYEEIYSPEVRDFVYITDKAYTREQILAMETAMLNCLEFRITVPTPYVFLNRFLKVANADPRTCLLATFITERTLQEYRCLAHAGSKVAAAAVNIALRTLRGPGAWDATMVAYSEYTTEELRPAVLDIQAILDSSVTASLQAVRKKYAQPKFGEVSNIPVARIM